MNKWLFMLLVFCIPLLSNGQGLRNTIANAEKKETSTKSKLMLGGYGEAVLSRMFYSSNYKRYSDAERYANDNGYGTMDLPHVVFVVGYDFGKGWKLFSEIEYEHGGVEAAVEIEEEETGEYESEIERGGEVVLEQFYLEKSFSDKMHLRMGHLVLPVGMTNQHHLPTEFFTVYRPEGESTIMPCTWHETGVGLWGKLSKWRYEVQLVAGLDADRFGSQNWIQTGSGSPYEFKMATSYAGVLRIDNYSIKNLRWALSGYMGNSAQNSLSPNKYDGLKGTVSIGAFDFKYESEKLIVRGHADYGHLSDSEAITAANTTMREDSPSPKTPIASDAIATGIEAGLDVLPWIAKQDDLEKKLYVFGRYEYYDSMYKTEGNVVDNESWGRQLVVGGLNYKPMKQIVIKAEYSQRIFKSQYNNEDTFSIGIAYAGFFR